jgi:chromosome partitioning protein
MSARHVEVCKLLITVAGFKGGIGKTTTAVHLACYFSQLGKTLLVDGDPNRSATGWSKRGDGDSFPFKVVDLMQAALYSPKYEHIVIDTAARPDENELQALADGCDLLILPTTPDALAVDALLQTVDLLQSLESDKPDGMAPRRYRILLTMVHPKPVKMAQQAREALAEVPLFDTEIRRLIAYEKAALMGVPVYEVKDRMAKIAWGDYEQVGKEIMS